MGGRRRTMGQRGAAPDPLRQLHGGSCNCAACRAERWELSKDRARRSKAETRPKVCPTCSIALPVTGVCDDCPPR